MNNKCIIILFLCSTFFEQIFTFTIRIGGKKESIETSPTIFKSIKDGVNKRIMRKTALNNVYQPCKLPDICLNGGTCINTGNDFECHCSSHYYGKHCQYVADLRNCLNNKCFVLKNDEGEIILQSTCYSLEKSVNVSNPDLRIYNTYKLNENEKELNKYVKSNYQFSSTLDPETKAYIEVQYGCWCPKGRSGYFCEYETINENCNYNTCNNHGQPEYDEKKKSCKCICEDGWRGLFCDQETKCKNIICGNGGYCNPNTGKCNCISEKDVFKNYPIEVEGNNCETVKLKHENFKMKIPCKASFLEYTKSLTEIRYNSNIIDKVVNLADIYQLIKNCNENRKNNKLPSDCEEILSTRNCYGQNSICILKIWHAPLVKPGYELNYTGNPEIDIRIRSKKTNSWPTVIPSCICEDNRAGVFCELENVNPCNSNPCQNDGKCIPLKYLDYKCNCINGTSGKNCEIIDPCFKNPCEWPGSTCVRKQQIIGMTVSYKYDCICPQTDSHKRVCQNSAQGACKNHKCKNNGHCALCPDSNGNSDSCSENDIIQGYRCICPFGHNGKYCEKDGNVCDYNLCQKNSTCEVEKNNPLNYKCNCKPGYTGKLCRLLTDWCAFKGNLLCGKNGVCHQNNKTAEHFYCKCKNDYEEIFFRTLFYRVSKLTPLEIQKLNFGYNSVTKTISECSKKFNKNVTLVAVSKYYSAEHIKYLYLEHNVRVFAESRIQNFQEKAVYLEKCCPDIKWHFIGKLQANKLNKLLNIKNIDMIQTIEDKKYATLLNETATKLNYDDKSLNVMVQVNVSGEDQKQGCNPNEVTDILNHIIENCPKLNLSGLMMIGEKHDSNEKEKAAEEFNMLRKIKCDIEEKDKKFSLKLSMGMSNDYDIAIECGSDYVRVGTNLFNPEI
uniref:Pyridoxal phosphate homeostasis protein n=1 Tax=Strongyloides stercoralis TaxID=6248 RepID=A0AAF5CXG2_STRER